MTLRQTLAKHFALYSMSFIFTQVVTIALAVFIRNVLGPEQMGVWVAVQVVLGYTKYIDMGLTGAAAIEIPIEKGRGHYEKAEKIRSASLTFTLLTSFALSLVLLAAAGVVGMRGNSMLCITLITLSALSFLQRISMFCINMARTEKRFDFINRYNIYSSLVNALLTVALITYGKLYGYYLSMVLSVCFNLGYAWFASGVSFKVRWEREELKPLFAMGAALILVNISHTLIDSVDKISISSFLGMKALGVYSVAFLASNLILAFPNNLGIILYPYLNEAYGAAKNPSEIRKFVVEPSLFIALYLPVLIAASWVVAPFLVTHLMPKYVEGIAPLKICLFGTLFQILSAQLSNVLVTFKRYRAVFLAQFLVGGAIYGVNYLLTRNGGGIEAVAWVELGGYLVLFSFYALTAIPAIAGTAEARKHVLKVWTAFACSLGLLLAMDKVTSTPAKALVWLAAVVPFLVWGERRFKTSQMLVHFLQRRPALGRALLYRDAQKYWEKRGGEKYFREQESREDRSATSRFLAGEISALGPGSILEVGCGYGKVLRSLREVTPVPLTGVDFSTSQLLKAKEYLAGLKDISLISADAERLPFPDNAFDVVFTSNVILHNAPEKADKMRSEIVRVARRFIVHKEDTDVNFSRYGYDHAKIYGRMGLRVLRAEKVACAADSDVTQFTIVEKSKRDDS